jgi:AraC-like DNA-binding protein
LRIYKACQLLAETELKITTIGLEVGYDTLSTFNRNFRRLAGRTPSAFRAERRFAEPASSNRTRSVDMGREVQGSPESTAKRGRPRLLSSPNAGAAADAPSIV